MINILDSPPFYVKHMTLAIWKLEAVQKRTHKICAVLANVYTHSSPNNAVSWTPCTDTLKLDRICVYKIYMQYMSDGL